MGGPFINRRLKDYKTEEITQGGKEDATGFSSALCIGKLALSRMRLESAVKMTLTWAR